MHATCMVRSAMLVKVRVSTNFHISPTKTRHNDVLRFRRPARRRVLWVVLLTFLVILTPMTFMIGSAVLAKINVSTSLHISPTTIRNEVGLHFRRLARRRELWVVFLSSLLILMPATCVAMNAMLAKIKVDGRCT